MSAFDQGPLARYNSLTDRHLMNYFNNDRMRRHLLKNGLITKRGEVVSDAVYRVKIARREHRRRVRDLIAQAIIHKALEMERSRQIDIRKKIEEIAKIELVRRVRTDRSRIGDEECVAYFNEGDMSVRSKSAKSRTRSLRTQADNDEIKLPITSEEASRLRLQKILPNEEIETKHLSQLDSLTLGEYAKILEKQDKLRMNKLPYLGMGNEFVQTNIKPVRMKTAFKLKKVQVPNKTEKEKDLILTQAEVEYNPIREESIISHKNSKTSNDIEMSLKKKKDNRSSTRNSSVSSINSRKTKSQCNLEDKNVSNKAVVINKKILKKNKNISQQKSKKKSRKDFSKSARSSQNKGASRPLVSILFNAPTGNRSFDVMVEQQPNGGNTLVLYKESITNNTVFQVTSHRHKGFPFSLTFYIDNVKDSRISTCCEYKHKVGKKIGGPAGHFTLFSVEGDSPCYKCLAERDLAGGKKENKFKDDFSEDYLDSNNFFFDAINSSRRMRSNHVEKCKVRSKSFLKVSHANQIPRTKYLYNHRRSLRVNMPFVDFYAKSNEQSSSRHETISVRSTSDDPDKSADDFESDSDSSKTVSESDEGNKVSSRHLHSSSKSSREQEILLSRNNDFEESTRKKTPEIEIKDPEEFKENNSNNNAIEDDKETFDNVNETETNDTVYLINPEEGNKNNVVVESNSMNRINLDKSQGENDYKPVEKIVNPGNNDTIHDKVEIVQLPNNSKEKEKNLSSSYESSFNLDNPDILLPKDTNVEIILNSEGSKENSDQNKELTKTIILPTNEGSKYDDTSIKKDTDVDNNEVKEPTSFLNQVLDYESSSSSSRSNRSDVDNGYATIVDKEVVKDSNAEKVQLSVISYHTVSNDHGSKIETENNSGDKYKSDTTLKFDKISDKPDLNLNDNNNGGIDVKMPNHNFHERKDSVIKNENEIKDLNNSYLDKDEERLTRINDTKKRKGSVVSNLDLNENDIKSVNNSNDLRDEERLIRVNDNYTNNEIKLIGVDSSESVEVQNENNYENLNINEVSPKTETEKTDNPVLSSESNIDGNGAQINDTTRSNLMESPGNFSEEYSSDSSSPESSVHQNAKNTIQNASLYENEHENLKIEIPKDDDGVSMSMEENKIEEPREEIRSPVISDMQNINAMNIMKDRRSTLERPPSSFTTSSSYGTETSSGVPIEVEHQADEDITNPGNKDTMQDNLFEEFDVFFENDDITFKKAKDKFESIGDQRVTSLIIRNCELPSYIFNYISNKLESKKDMKRIELKGCEVEISLLKLLAKALDKWPALDILIISNNVFMDYSLFDLLTAICYIYNNDKGDAKLTLKLFDISNCMLQENDFGQIIKMIADNTCVENIILDHNPISEIMWKDLKEALVKNTNTKSVSIKNCVTNESLLEKISKESLSDIRARLIIY